MDQKRIGLADIVLGEPLPWDVFDANNKLLLRKGFIVEREQQIETLIERGLFIDASRSKKREAIESQKETPSVLRLVVAAGKQLERLLYGIGNDGDVTDRILEVAKVLNFASDLNRDVALACILHNQAGLRYAVRHCVDAAAVSIIIAKALKKGNDEVMSIAAAALTMNVGMLRDQEQFQIKSSTLTQEELDVIHNHPKRGMELLIESGVKDKDWLNYVLLHHENEDGSGYPLGKVSTEIPENAKIIAISDRYCARVSTRAYRKSLLPNAALRDILLSEKKNIDPAIATAFIRELGIYPTGTFVRLENGEVGIVTGKGNTTTTPFVHALIGPRGAPLAFPIKRDTSKSLHAIRDVLHEEQAAFRLSLQHIWGDEARP